MYDLAMIMHSMKMARIPSSPTMDDHYIDGINYLSMAAQFSRSEEQVKTALEEDIAAMARKFAPVRPEMPNPQIVQTTMPTPEPKSE